MKKVLLSIVLGVVTGVSMLGSNIDSNPNKKSPKKTYILRLTEDRVIKTKLIGTLKHSLMYTASDMDSTYSVFIPILYGGKLNHEETVVEIRPKKVIDKDNSPRIVRFDK